MKTISLLVVYANPFADTFNAALLQAFLKGAKRGGHAVEVLDLYKEKFNPVLYAKDVELRTPPAILEIQDKVREADCLVFIFPVWWFRAPALLEGWFDRVFTSGFAYKMTKKWGMPWVHGLLKGKKAVVIETYGATRTLNSLIYANLTWRRLRTGVLKYVGIQKIIHHPCFAANYVSEKRRQTWLKQVQTLAEKLK